MNNWFGTFDARTKKLNLKTVTELFEHEMKAMHNQFLTVRQGPGYHTSNTWRPIETRGATYYVCLASFTFTDVASVSDQRNYDSYWTPVLTLIIKFAKPGTSRDPLRTVYDDNGTHQLRLQDYFSQPVRVEYHANFPSVPPRIRVEKPEYIRMNGDHDNHILYNGWICYFRDGEGWSPEVSTTVTGLNEALGWMIWHYKKFIW